MLFYTIEFARGNLGLLCDSCNGRKQDAGPEFYPPERLALRTPEFNAAARFVRRADKSWPSTMDEQEFWATHGGEYGVGGAPPGKSGINWARLQEKARKRLADRQAYRRGGQTSGRANRRKAS